MKHKQCQCKKPKIRIIGNCEVCSICFGLIYKIRNTFNKKTSVKPKKNKYSRSKEKIQARKEIEDYDGDN